MSGITLVQVALFLVAAAVAAPLAKAARIGTVLGYLLAGVIIGPFVLGRLTTFGIDDHTGAHQVLEFAEFGVILLLFLIGLELRPTRLWSMRMAIFGLGGAQVGITAVALAAIGVMLGLAVLPALFMGLALSLSSTAFALQILEDKGELTARHGRSAFAILLFQDLAAIPLIALAPLFVVSALPKMPVMDVWSAGRALLTIAAVAFAGRFVVDNVFRVIAGMRVQEAMTALALLTVIVVVLVMQWAGLSASLGAFLAGALLSESQYRHQIEADIKPFEGLLLGLFFTAVGMSLDVSIIVGQPGLVLGFTALLILVKCIVLYGLGRWQGLTDPSARRLAFAISQGGEFAFVLFTSGVAVGVLQSDVAALATVVVTLSMAATPILLLLDDLTRRKVRAPLPAFETPAPNNKHVIIAGFGRVGQIVARVLRAKRIPITALDINPEQVQVMRKFGARIYYGDASRSDILEAAQADKAQAFVLAIDDMEASLRTAEAVRRQFPTLPIYARARNRVHVHRLIDLGVKIIRRETYLSTLDLTREVLRGLGMAEREVRYSIETFQRHDERRLLEDHKHYADLEKLQARARSDAEELERLLDLDALDQLKDAEAAAAAPQAKAS
ncbi:MAG: cation:proton antiporter [Hyphomicrobiaceae bacterium]